MLIKKRSKKGQVWIETVTYTLVAFVLIGLVLAFAKPKIEELQDQAIIEQSIKMIKQIDSVIEEINDGGVGNKRNVEMEIKKGEIELNSENNSLIFRLEGSFMYSQPGQQYEEGNLLILTEEIGKEYHVTVEKIYEDFNLTYFDKEDTKILLKASTPYSVFITNKGGNDNNINFEVE